MRKRYVLSMLAMACMILGGFYTKNVSAVSSNIVISQVQLGDAKSGRNEFIELFNNSPDDVEITNWCLYYASAGSLEIGSQRGCFLVDNKALHIFVPGKAFIFAASSQLVASLPAIGNDLMFSATFSDVAGHIRLIDSFESEVDKVGWGTTAKTAETIPAIVPPSGSVLQRKVDPSGVLQDTDNNFNDFESVVPRLKYTYGAIYEVQDICLNIDEIQKVAPKGYTTDIEGNCYPPPVDVCLNIDSLQIIMPDGYALDDSGDCINMDICLNLAGIQLVLPPSYKLASDSICLLDLLPLQITEMLPNAPGDDNGREFIELYNPNDIAVDLTYYRLGIGLNHEKLYSFLEGSNINPGSYAIFSNDDINFKLVNTSSQVTVMTADGVVVDESPAYADAKDDEAWALINGTWQYTNQSTPGTGNIPSFVESDEKMDTTSNLAPCASNQYRSLETNRCRLLTAASSVLTPCKDGQYRSEETNRCRSIAVDAGALVSCGDNQERNLATNRCRLVAVAEVPAACKQGQERNPETNRCRNSVAISTAAYPVEPVDVHSGDYIGWLALGGVGVLAVGYGVWEWRSEITQATQKLRSFFHFKK